MLINFSDTNNFATKACYAILDGEERNVVKSPTEMDANGNITKSFKKSKQGKLKLVKNADGTYRTEPHYSGVMVHNLFPLSTTHCYRDWETDRKSTRLNSSHSAKSRMPSSA